MAKPNKLSLEEHDQLGDDLQDVRDKIMSWSVKIGNTYPMKCEEFKRIDKLLQTIDVLRVNMENRLAAEHFSKNRLECPPFYFIRSRK